MDINKYTTGMIFSLDDRNYGNPNGKEVRHYYVVVGVPNEGDHISLYQCMSITSLHNKEEMETDIPIVLNGKIGFINTKNIASFSDRRLEEDGAYLGIINDDRNFTKSELVALLLKSFMMTHYQALDDNTYYGIRTEISKYKDMFRRFNKGKVEYREEKIFGVMDKVLSDSGVKESLNLETVGDIKKSQTPSIVTVKKTGHKIDEILKEYQTEGSFVKKEAVGAKNGPKKKLHGQTIKFMLRSMYEMENGVPLKKWNVQTLVNFIKTYEEYGPAFFIKNSSRFKGKTNATMLYHYNNAVERLNEILETEYKKVSGGGTSLVLTV